jgi:hypothetical protein
VECAYGVGVVGAGGDCCQGVGSLKNINGHGSTRKNTEEKIKQDRNGHGIHGRTWKNKIYDYIQGAGSLLLVVMR